MKFEPRHVFRATLCACLLAAPAIVATAATPAVRVEQAWIRWLPANLPVAGYATIVNDGDGMQRLTEVSSPDYGSVMLHRSRIGDAAQLKLAWRQWLALFNVLQVLPNVFLLDDEGVAHGDYTGLYSQISASQATGDEQAWVKAMAAAIGAVRPGLALLQTLGVDPPDRIGFEWEEDGEVVAEAELVWDGAHIVVLTENQMEQAAHWSAQAWRVMAVDGPDWPHRVATIIQGESES